MFSFFLQFVRGCMCSLERDGRERRQREEALLVGQGLTATCSPLRFLVGILGLRAHGPGMCFMLPSELRLAVIGCVGSSFRPQAGPKEF